LAQVPEASDLAGERLARECGGWVQICLFTGCARVGG